MNIATLLQNAGCNYGDKPAVCLGDSTVHTYARLCARAAALASCLRSKFGLEQGDRIAIVMTNVPEYLEVLFGTWWAGMIVVPINARLHAREIEYILQKSNARLCFVNADTESALSDISLSAEALKHVISVQGHEFRQMQMSDPSELVHCETAEPAWLFFTSGTTGRPKAATLTHRNLLMMTLSYLADIQHVTPHHAIFHAAPMSHGTGLLAIPHLAKGSPNVLLESRSLDHSEIFETLGTYRNVTMYHTPTMVKRLTNHPQLATAPLQNLDCVFYGGSPMYVADLMLAIERLGPRLAQMWAQAETPNTGTVLTKAHHADTGHPRYMARMASAGTVRTGVELRTADPSGETVPCGELGEVLVRGDTVMAGYWEAPEATAETIRGGWLHTGDIGSIDQDGFLSIQDRVKDMIISGGFNIYPREIEEVLLSHRGVAEAAVIGRPHSDLVEEVVACVVTAPGETVTASDLDGLCLNHIARFKRPREYFFLSELPKGYYGKIEKRRLREHLAHGSNQSLESKA